MDGVQQIAGQRQTATGDAKGAISRLIVFGGLCLWIFWSEAANIALLSTQSSETAHVLISPIVIAVLIYLRREVLLKSLSQGSMWGIALIVIGLIMYGGAIWPFNYGYARELAILPVLAGVVLVTCGGRFLRHFSPVFLVILLSIPIGSRIYASLIIRPETYTISATATALEQLPALEVTPKGTDLFFSLNHNPGVIGLGESNRGARLLLASGMLGVFVIFSRLRSLPRLAAAAMLAVPIILLCNFIRFLSWAMVVIYSQAAPTSPLPRNVSAICCLSAVYILFSFVCNFKLNLFVSEDV
jgi:hypothetical protein